MFDSDDLVQQDNKIPITDFTFGERIASKRNDFFMVDVEFTKLWNRVTRNC